MADRAAGLPIAREGIPFILGAAVPAAVAGLAGWVGVSIFLGVLTGFVSWFFRNPHRVPPPGEQFILSPADGRVVAVHEEFEPRYLKDQAIRVSIFLNIFNVHINRVPCEGRIVDIVYQPGQFLAANRPEATVRNEQNAVMLETANRTKVLCVQIAGLIARRIICWVSPEEHVSRGERFGLIRFGSRVDTFLPMGSRIRVQVGNAVKGGKTIIGELP